MLDWIQTNSGNEFHYTLDKTILVSQVNLNDIAHSLYAQCRFLGHTEARISILQHSLAVAAIVPKRLRLQALLHDAAEAYTGDIPTPLKRKLGQDFRDLEEAIESAIRYVFNLPEELDPIVKAADEAILFYEKYRYFKKELDWGWKPQFKAKGDLIAEYYIFDQSPSFFKSEVMKCLR